MKAVRVKNKITEREPVLIGDAAVASRFLRTPRKRAAFPGDPLANHIHRLLQLHPALAAHFGAVKLATMNESGKRLLLQDMNRVLGVGPIRPSGARKKTKATQRAAL